MAPLPHSERGPNPSEVQEAAAMLEGMIGQGLTAYALNVRDPRSIGRFARGDRPDPDTAAQLMAIQEVLAKVSEVESEDAIQKWMIGSDPVIEDRAPVEALHDGDFETFETSAQAFVRQG